MKLQHLTVRMYSNTIVEVVDDRPQNQHRKWWYYDIANMTSSVYGERHEAPSERMPPHAIAKFNRYIKPMVT